MATHAKYTPAAQVDPDEHDDYTQAPPSYQAEASSANDEERLFAGGRRSSEDNIPDDFKVKNILDRPSSNNQLRYSGDGHVQR